MKDCEEIYNRIKSHQIKGTEISYYTFEKQLKKCQDYKNEDPLKLISCYNYKLNKLSMRFGSYYLNQRLNLIDRLSKQY